MPNNEPPTHQSAERKEWEDDERRYRQDPQKYWEDLGRKGPPNPLRRAPQPADKK